MPCFGLPALHCQGQNNTDLHVGNSSHFASLTRQGEVSSTGVWRSFDTGRRWRCRCASPPACCSPRMEAALHHISREPGGDFAGGLAASLNDCGAAFTRMAEGGPVLPHWGRCPAKAYSQAGVFFLCCLKTRRHPISRCLLRSQWCYMCLKGCCSV